MSAAAVLRVVVAVCLALGTGDARAQAAAPTPSERDAAYEEGVVAEERGEHVRAAAAYERAYRLTLAAETGPRLLFLRASVAARLRADDGTSATREQLCRAQALLRGYLGEAGDPATEEHANLGRIDQRIALAPGPDCATLLAVGAPVVVAEPVPPVPVPVATPVRPGTPAPAPMERRTPGQRALLVGGILGLGVGVAGIAVMGSGVTIIRRANQRGREACVLAESGCSAIDPSVTDIVADGQRGERLRNIGAVVGGLGLIVGVALVVAGELQHRRARVTVTPRLGAGELGVGLAGRF